MNVSFVTADLQSGVVKLTVNIDDVEHTIDVDPMEYILCLAREQRRKQGEDGRELGRSLHVIKQSANDYGDIAPNMHFSVMDDKGEFYHLYIPVTDILLQLAMSYQSDRLCARMKKFYALSSKDSQKHNQKEQQ